VARETEPRVYIVRVWATAAGAGSLRALVRRVEAEESRLFTSARQLARYLADEAAAPPT